MRTMTGWDSTDATGVGRTLTQGISFFATENMASNPACGFTFMREGCKRDTTESRITSVAGRATTFTQRGEGRSAMATTRRDERE
ncbi:hypothetical protein TSUD_179250 [Trifolium subterraneum]|uniref:Uncharacterized protein n=1 Tax=Trifolium subterraneum TaxID=3900 RepID=A0A2Z6M314_TRISU|nr:hypothetical protein TSUD_179250 [Trifolium subterraneum]